jgi:tetratricopeptide (TPR) repeat protein
MISLNNFKPRMRGSIATALMLRVPLTLLLFLALVLLPACDRRKEAAYHFTLAQNHYEQKLYHLALEECDTANQYTPGNHALLALRGRIHLALENPDLALEDVNEALRLAPDDAECHHIRAQIWSSLDDVPAALADIDKAESLEPGATPFGLTRARMAAERADFEGALACLARVSAGSISDHQQGIAEVERARVHMAAGQLDSAAAVIADLLRQQPQFPQALRARGLLHLLRAQWQEAESELKAAEERGGVEEEFVLSPLPLYRWICQSRMGGHDEAARTVRFYLQWWDQVHRSDAWIEAVASFLLGETTHEALLNAAASASPEARRRKHCAAHCYIGLKHLLAGDEAAAVASFRQSLAQQSPLTFEAMLAREELRRLDPNTPQKK